MAEDLEDASFWLPSHFLDDDPPGSEMEDEEAEEEASSKSPPRDVGDSPRKGASAFSPPSTLYGFGSWSFSSREGSTEGCSTPPSPLGRDEHWDHDEDGEQLASADPPGKRKAEARQQRRAWGGAAAGAAPRAVLPLGLSASAWPPLGPAVPVGPGSGMRAVFIPQKEPVGTGVFLPRNAAGVVPAAPRKPACSTVFLPAKVAQALNMHGRLAGGSGLSQDVIFLHNVTLLQKRGLLPRLVQPPPPATEAGEEMGLPPEWTY